jgi:hypothetical protein
LIKHVSKLLKLVCNADSELVIRSLPMQSLQKYLDLGPYLIPLFQAL